MLTHSNILATSTGACFWSETSSETVVLGVLPMFHLTGMQSNMNVPIQLGATTVLMTRWDRDTAAALIERHRVTGVTGITTMIVDLLRVRTSRNTTFRRSAGSAAAALRCRRR
jgi:fatty-acyl-CoA synthase